MAEIILYGIATDVLKKLGSDALTEIASAWGFKTDLNKLKDTILTIKDVLLDAEDKQANSAAVRRWLQRLATVVYAADDLFDEYATLAARKQLMGGNKATKEVITFFSPSNQIALAIKISSKIKKIRKQLHDVKKDATFLEFECGSTQRSSAMMRDQTISYVDENGVVGRDDDKKAIMAMLLASSEEELPVISIVGMGGLGKTALAQLMYNDPQVGKSFDLRLWVCVSDDFNIKEIIDKLLKSATNKETPKLEMDQLQIKLREELTGKRYLLVLDDVWNEKRQQWLTLRDLLRVGRKGSKILVTTRSWEVVKIIGTSTSFDLKGLSEEKSWKLFEKMAFKPDEAENKPHFVKMGREIVDKCGHVPLAIRTLGSLLYGQEESKWVNVRNASLSNQSDIMNILKLSYHHLWSPLKNCFAYCSLFPKDYEFQKEVLIDLWIAEGFIVSPTNDGQTVDKVAEEYFHTLLQRGFFQDIKRNEMGIIESCKMHDLMHDLAQDVAGVNCKVAKFDEEWNFDEKCVHVSLAGQFTSSREILKSMLNMKLLRTFLVPLRFTVSKSSSPQLITQFRSLRVLHLHDHGLKSLPCSIGELIHLRYLDLSETNIKKLPDSITNLWNLQILQLNSCGKLTALPTKIRKLSNLKSVNVRFCYQLVQMPSGLGGLTSLSKLPLFIVHHNKRDASNSRHKCMAKLSDLKNLNYLTGRLRIQIQGSIENSMSEATEADLSSKQGLTDLEIIFFHARTDDYGAAADCNHDENVLEGLEPPSDMRRLCIEHYKGQKLPRWAKIDNLCTTLPNLVDIKLEDWKWCQQLPTFSKLPRLKCLTLMDMKSVEYIENGVSSKSAELFFPSLEEVWLSEMGNLKGWWKEVEVEPTEGENDTLSEVAGQHFPATFMQFPKLSQLIVHACPNLRMLPLCPNVEKLSLQGTNERLTVLKRATTTLSSSSVRSSSSSIGGSGLKIKKLHTDNTEELMSLPHHSLHQLSSILVYGDNKLESTERLGEVLANLSPSVQILSFNECNNLRNIAKGWKHLTTLEDLRFSNCKEVGVIGDEELEEGMPWKALNTSLRSLRLWGLPKLVGLPKGLQQLSNLHSLILIDLEKLQELPEWIDSLSCLEELVFDGCPNLSSMPKGFRKLTSLRRLTIRRCEGLTESCRGPNGRDWPKIEYLIQTSQIYFELVD